MTIPQPGISFTPHEPDPELVDFGASQCRVCDREPTVAVEVGNVNFVLCDTHRADLAGRALAVPFCPSCKTTDEVEYAGVLDVSGQPFWRCYAAHGRGRPLTFDLQPEPEHGTSARDIDLDTSAKLWNCSRAEALNKALRLGAQMLNFTEDGGEVVIEKDGVSERVVWA